MEVLEDRYEQTYDVSVTDAIVRGFGKYYWSVKEHPTNRYQIPDTVASGFAITVNSAKRKIDRAIKKDLKRKVKQALTPDFPYEKTVTVHEFKPGMEPFEF